MDVEVSIYSTLVIVALGLLVFVTGGVLYLTAIEWRDRRRIKQEERDR